MRSLLLVLLVCSTSLVLYRFGRSVLGYQRPKVSGLVTSTLESMGLAALFFIGNTLIGVLVVVGVRTLTPLFLSVYAFSEPTLIPLSLIQALAFVAWRQQRHHQNGDRHA